MLTFKSTRVVAIGEAMIEMAVIGEDTYRRSFAGDTFNTAWHLAQLLGTPGQVGFVTKVGRDSASAAFLAQCALDGLDASCIGQVDDRTLGLYMIALNGVEREFQYWRAQSAARFLADDPRWLGAAIGHAGLLHLSGITLAILSAEARNRLWDVIAAARSQGARLSFDPNVRPKLWSSPEETRTTLSAFLDITDIAMPSFDDEAALWGDKSPQATLDRLQKVGIEEIAIKNGENAIVGLCAGKQTTFETPSVREIRDTSGAGDAFNAGYLAARLMGKGQDGAVAAGQGISSEVLRHFGARIPKNHMSKLIERM